MHRVGAGSGIFTRAMLAHPDWSSSIARLKAIDPSEGMRGVFSKTIKDDRVTVADGVFERTGVEDGWADVVVIAQVRNHLLSSILLTTSQSMQALHWALDFDAAMAENARIMKPNGVLACIWNLDDRYDALRSHLFTFQHFSRQEMPLDGLLRSAIELNGMIKGLLTPGTAFGIKHSTRLRTSGSSAHLTKKSSRTTCLVPWMKSPVALSAVAMSPHCQKTRRPKSKGIWKRPSRRVTVRYGLMRVRVYLNTLSRLPL
jgi:SAM-dependent methyltransferase